VLVQILDPKDIGYISAQLPYKVGNQILKSGSKVASMNYNSQNKWKKKTHKRIEITEYFKVVHPSGVEPETC
jgi:hypothetical protein